jgi:SAM-dependent methyltransferase
MRIRQPWPIVRSRQRERDFAALFGGVPPGALGDMLEIGSGDGFNASLLAPLGKSLVMSEPSPGRAKFAGELPRVRCSATALPFRDASFDFIFSSSVLEHIRDRVRAFAEIKRCLRPGGVMVHVMPSTTWKWLQLIFYYPHVAISGLEMIGAKKELPETTSTELWHTGGKKPTWWQEFKTGVLPPVHGEFDGHVREMIGFRAKSWRRELEAAGFDVHNRLRLPLCSGYGFGLERLRWVGEKCGMSAHNAFVVTHAGASAALPECWQ